MSDISLNASSMAAVLADLRARGFTHALEPGPDGRMRSATLSMSVDPHEATIEEVQRGWGPSDVEDEEIVLGVRWCERGETMRGILVLGFGPAASAEDAAVMSSLRREGVEPG